MPDDLVPADLRDFILERIDTVAQLEAILLLRKYPERVWSVAEVAARLYIDNAGAETLLRKLCADGLCVEEEQSFRFQPSSTELSSMIDRVAECYVHYLIPVTKLIYNKPARIHKFADAFRFRKDK